MVSVPGQWTNDPDVFPSPQALRILAGATKVGRAAIFARSKAVASGKEPEYDEEAAIIQEIRLRKESLDEEQAARRLMFDRMDNLFYPQVVTNPGGADHWPLEKQAAGEVHVSVNNIDPYVTIPASLQAFVPVENYVPEEDSDSEREAAARRERLYFSWKDSEEFELKAHRACFVKELYGFTFAKVWWNAEEKRPSVTILDRPDNLYAGWGASDYSRLDWTVYCYGISAQSAREEYGLDVVPIPVGDDKFVPYVTSDHSDPIGSVYGTNAIVRGRIRSKYERDQIEVYDYWYKKAQGKGKKPAIWNALYVGNALVQNVEHKEFDDIPYILLPNTFVPGFPIGKPALYDLEQLFREKDERITAAAQMIQSVVGGQMWQLTGSEAPEEVPSSAIPKVNTVAAPGPNARIEAIQPFMPQFAVEDYLKRIDKELVEASGLSGPLLGNSPQDLSSSKAFIALVHQYGARISMKRDLLYSWRKKVWRVVAMCWERKNNEIKSLIDGKYRLSVLAPDLTPRDELENAQKVINLVQNGIMSLRYAMDQVGIEDPEAEIVLIKQENSDPALKPEKVQAQVTLAAAMAQFGGQGVVPEQGGQNPANGPTPAAGTPGQSQPENAANPPPESQPENALAGNGAKAQTLVQGGEGTGRILTSAPL